MPPPPPPSEASDATKERFKKYLKSQPPPCIIFRGTGARISQRERDAYPSDLVVLWQPKAWVDRPTAVAWAKEGFKPVIDADIAAGVSDADSRYLLFQDNLDAQCQPEYLDFLKTRCQTDDHKVSCPSLKLCESLIPPSLSSLLSIVYSCFLWLRCRPIRLTRCSLSTEAWAGILKSIWGKRRMHGLKMTRTCRCGRITS
jgi:hypothetical protein